MGLVAIINGRRRKTLEELRKDRQRAGMAILLMGTPEEIAGSVNGLLLHLSTTPEGEKFGAMEVGEKAHRLHKRLIAAAKKAARKPAGEAH